MIRQIIKEFSEDLKDIINIFKETQVDNNKNKVERAKNVK